MAVGLNGCPILEGFLIAWIPTRIISDITGTTGLAIVDAILALEDLRRVELMFFAAKSVGRAQGSNALFDRRWLHC
jgi:hypothetical protein